MPFEWSSFVDAFESVADFDYANPWAFWFLLALPALALFEFWPGRSRHGAMAFTRASAFGRGGLSRGWRVYLVPVPRALRLAALALLILAMARPQISESEEARVEGIDIYLVLDMSGSMQAVDMTLAEVEQLRALGDTPSNRFENAKTVLRDFIASRRERCKSPPEGAHARCDRIGMVVFGRDAFLEFPLTLDYSTILTLLEKRQLEDIDGSGTAIGNATARAVAGLRHSDAKSKVVVLITDGDRRGGDISPAQAASMAQHFDIKVFPILVGSEGSTLLPGHDPFSPFSSYQVVEFPVNPALLEKIATMTEGKFYRATDKAALERDLHDILDHFEVTKIEGSVDVSTTERYQPFAWSALAFLVLGSLLELLVIRKFP